MADLPRQPFDIHVGTHPRRQVTDLPFHLIERADEVRKRPPELAAPLVANPECRNKAGALTAEFGARNAKVVQASRGGSRF